MSGRVSCVEVGILSFDRKSSALGRSRMSAVGRASTVSSYAQKFLLLRYVGVEDPLVGRCSEISA
jgi:hypothetical protein